MNDPKDFFDRVYACWMGKNIGGTLGGPLEGRMELMNIQGYTQSFIEPVENDDLDLQLVNLHCVEQYGGRADSALLSREWLEHVHFQYDEYGHSLTNMRRGIGSPISGRYNNFFTDCMGSPIRSEIWAVLCAGMPDIAAYYAYQDASVDHAGGEGMYGEIFFAVLECLAFEETDKFILIDKALSYLPKTSAVRGAVELLLECYRTNRSWLEARQAIIDKYAGENFTYAPVNIAFTLIGWLYAEGFTAQMLMTIDCGYDTDCTVATLGSLLGILYGTKYLDPYWTEPLGEHIITSHPITGFRAPSTITELTKRSIAARELVRTHYDHRQNDKDYLIPYRSDAEIYRLPFGAFREHDLEIEIFRCPAFAPKEIKNVFVLVRNLQSIPQTLLFEIHADAFVAKPQCVTIKPNEQKELTFAVSAPDHIPALVRGTLDITRILNGVRWNTESLPMSMLPTMDWRYTTNTTSGILHCTENRITAKMLPATNETLALESVLRFSDSCAATLKFVCANALRVWINGEKQIDCTERTAVIPAYHRADPRKCIDLPENTKRCEIRVEIDASSGFDAFYFMVVSPEQYWAYRIDSTFSIS